MVYSRVKAISNPFSRLRDHSALEVQQGKALVTAGKWQMRRGAQAAA